MPVRLAVVAILVTMGVAFAPGQATAACGDYVHIEGQAEPEQQVTSVPMSQDVPVSPRPCNGPSCSERPQAPDVPPGAPVVVSSHGKQVAMRPGREAECDSQIEWVIASHAADRGVRLPSAIFHPPRAR